MTHTIEDYNKEKQAILDDINDVIKCVNDLSNNISKPNFVNKTIKKIVPIKNNNGVHLYRNNQIIDITDNTKFENTDELVIVYSNHSFIVCKEDVEPVPFFASKEDKETAMKECVGGDSDGLIVGYFETSRDLRIIDLTSIPEQSFWVNNWQGNQFLHHFNENITKRVNPKDTNHLQYVPTQIFTEYLRIFCRKLLWCMVVGKMRLRNGKTKQISAPRH